MLPEPDGFRGGRLYRKTLWHRYLLAKIKGIFKRRYSLDTIIDGSLTLNNESRTLEKNGVKLDLTGKEYELLLLLMENRGKALKKEFLFHQVWGSDSFSGLQTLTVHIKWLRQKIEDDPKNPAKILTVWGVGYKYLWQHTKKFLHWWFFSPQ